MQNIFYFQFWKFQAMAWTIFMIFWIALGIGSKKWNPFFFQLVPTFPIAVIL